MRGMSVMGRPGSRKAEQVMRDLSLGLIALHRVYDTDPDLVAATGALLQRLAQRHLDLGMSLESSASLTSLIKELDKARRRRSKRRRSEQTQQTQWKQLTLDI